MQNIIISKKDEIVMSLIHYFVTEENYNPIVVRGVQDEIWLENTDATYKIIRINSKHIHNDEQYKFDLFKTKSVMKQIKKKTISINMNALNIFIDVDDRVKIDKIKNVDSIKIKGLDEIKENNDLISVFPKIKNKLISKTEGLDFFLNVTNDLNKHTEQENELYEKTFKPKLPIITYIFLTVCVLYYLVIGIISKNIIEPDAISLLKFGALNSTAIRLGEYQRLIISVFMHGNIIHLLVNMYSLFIIGKQLESYYGKLKYFIITIFSGICGSLLCAAVGCECGVGFSGALFGMMGALLYFGYYYRLYLSQSLKTQIIPVIIYNLALSLIIPGISLTAHIGGLAGGFLISMALGVNGKKKKNDQINGIITSLILIAFLVYLAIFR